MARDCVKLKKTQGGRGKWTLESRFIRQEAIKLDEF